MPIELVLPQIIAHRGAAKVAPENTLAALKKAKELGAAWVEFDVALTRDGEAIIFHDHRLNRTTNGQGALAKTYYRDIAKLDAGSWFSPEFVDEPVPTLAEWLECAAELGLGVNIEIKGTRSQAHSLAMHVVTALAKYWNRDLPKPLISSQSPACLQAIYQVAPQHWLGLITDRWYYNWLSALNRLHCISLHINHRRLSKRRVTQIKAQGKKVLAYTVNDRARAEQLLEWGVDAIFSDDPTLLVA